MIDLFIAKNYHRVQNRKSSKIFNPHKNLRKNICKDTSFQIHPPVHSDGCEGEDRNIHCDRLDEEHQVAHWATKNPPVWVEGVRQGERDARDTHEHVRKRQVSNEKVGDVVHLPGSADDVQQQVVPKHPHHHHQDVAGNDERLERLQQSHICKLGAEIAGVALHGDFINATVGLISKHRWWRAPSGVIALQVITLHGSGAEYLHGEK